MSRRPAPSIAQAQAALVEAIRRESTGMSSDDIAALERDVHVARGVARALWNVLSVKLQHLMADDFLNHEGRAIVDPAFDATLKLWDRERILVEPAGELKFLLTWPGGQSRTVERDQLMMLAGLSPSGNEA